MFEITVFFAVECKETMAKRQEILGEINFDRTC